MMRFPIFGKRRREQLAELNIISMSGGLKEEDKFAWQSEAMSDKEKELRAVFDRIDDRKDAQIDVTELARALKKLGLREPKKSAQAILWEVDEDMDGLIGYSEFKDFYRRAAEDKLGSEPRKLYNVIEFMLADDDGSGTLTLDEVIDCFGRRYGVRKIDGLVQRFFTEEERANPKASISFGDFVLRDSQFMAESSKKHRESYLSYGKATEAGANVDPAPLRPKPSWRGGGGPGRANTSVGFSPKEAKKMLVDLGLGLDAAENHMKVVKERNGRRRREGGLSNAKFRV